MTMAEIYNHQSDFIDQVEFVSYPTKRHTCSHQSTSSPGIFTVQGLQETRANLSDDQMKLVIFIGS